MNTQSVQNNAVLPQTINIHLTRVCNFGCEYCYAEFQETGSVRIEPRQLLEIVNRIAATPLVEGAESRKVNFAGGEPFLYPGLPEIIASAKNARLKTSVVTNGSLLDERLMNQLAGNLDILALSVDSFSSDTNRRIGRCGRGSPPDFNHYLTVSDRVHRAGSRLKVNTVVNRMNVNEDIGSQIAALGPFRWKILQAKRVFGQNDGAFGRVEVNDEEFRAYVERNRRSVGPSVVIVPETAEEMTSSYAMIAPNGCFFDNSLGYYRYSRPIGEVGLIEAFNDVVFSEQKFMNRGGLYA